MPSNIGNLTESQLESLNEMKNLAQDILRPQDTDAVLLKWLRARNYNPKKAEQYFRERSNIQKVYEHASIVDTYTKPKIIEEYEYTSFIGFAKDGSIVRYNAFGTGDHYGFTMCFNSYDLVQYASYMIEKDIKLMLKENERTGKEVNEVTYIFDMEGFAFQTVFHKSLLEMAFDLGFMVQEYHPELWGNVFFINVPSFFDTLHALFKPILGRTLTDKLKVLTKESTPVVLPKYIDADILPKFLGGNRVDANGDPRCNEFMRYGGKIPEIHYLCNKELHLQPTDPDVTSVWVPPRGYYNHCFVVKNPKSRFKIEFRTEDGSINYRILLKESFDVIPGPDTYLDERDEKTGVTLLSPPLWVQTHLCPLEAECAAPFTGVWILRFGNTRSLIYSRRLFFRIKFYEPESTPDSSL